MLCVDSTAAGGKSREQQNERLTVSLLTSVALPGRVFVVTPTDEFRKIARRMIRENSWRVFTRDPDPGKP